MKRLPGFGKKLKVLVSVLMAVTLLATSAVGLVTSYRFIKNDMEKQIDSNIMHYTNQMEGWLSTQRTSIDFLADNIVQNNLYSKQEIHTYIKNMKNASGNANTSSLYVAFPDKTMVEFNDWQPGPDFDLTQRGWYIQALDSEEAVFTDPYVDAISGKFVVTVSKRIMRNGALYAVIGADIFMDALTDILQESQTNDGAYVFLTTEDMQIIQHPNADYSLGESGSTQLADGANGAYAPIGDLIFNGGEQSIRLKDYDGKTKYAAASTLTFSGWRAIGMFPASRIINEILWALTFYGISFVVLLGAALFYITRVSKQWFNPLVSMSDKMQQIADGDLSVEFAEKAVSQEMAVVSAALTKTAQSVNLYISDIKQVLLNVEQGNLAAKPAAHYQGDYVAIRDSLDHILQSLNRVFGSLHTAASQVSEGAGSMASAAQNLSQTASQQSSDLDHITLAVAEISKQTQEAAHGASRINQIAQSSKEETVKGNRQMQSMLQSMGEIDSSSKEIQKIIKTIDDIAFQTNILALNAAVEAARAGASGKGFAVVADEVRNLANRSAEAAQQTTNYITRSVESIARGQQIAQSTADSLQAITQNVDEMAGLVAGIEQSSHAQADAVLLVTQSIEQVSAAVQSNSATAEETAASSQELSGQAHMMRSQLEQYRLSSTESPRTASAEETAFQVSPPWFAETGMKY